MDFIKAVVIAGSITAVIIYAGLKLGIPLQNEKVIYVGTFDCGPQEHSTISFPQGTPKNVTITPCYLLSDGVFCPEDPSVYPELIDGEWHMPGYQKDTPTIRIRTVPFKSEPWWDVELTATSTATPTPEPTFSDKCDWSKGAPIQACDTYTMSCTGHDSSLECHCLYTDYNGKQIPIRCFK